MFGKEIILENSRLKLRPLRLEDANGLYNIIEQYNDLLKYSPSNIVSIKSMQAYIAQALLDRSNNTAYPFLLYDNKKGN